MVLNVVSCMTRTQLKGTKVQTVTGKMFDEDQVAVNPHGGFTSCISNGIIVLASRTILSPKSSGCGVGNLTISMKPEPSFIIRQMLPTHESFQAAPSHWDLFRGRRRALVAAGQILYLRARSIFTISFEVGVQSEADGSIIGIVSACQKPFLPHTFVGLPVPQWLFYGMYESGRMTFPFTSRPSN